MIEDHGGALVAQAGELRAASRPSRWSRGGGLLALTWPRVAGRTEVPVFATNTAAIPINRHGLNAPTDANDDGRILIHELLHALVNQDDSLHRLIGRTPYTSTPEWCPHSGNVGSEPRKRMLAELHNRTRAENGATGLLT